MNANKIIADALLRSGYKTVMITYAPDFNVNDIKVDVGQTIEKLKD